MGTTAALIAVTVVAAASASYQGYQANKDKPLPELPPLPPNASQSEKEARKNAEGARRKQNLTTSGDSGTGSTILTGGGNSLGQPGAASGDPPPKSLLGL